jgi:hypothetical protein
MFLHLTVSLMLNVCTFAATGQLTTHSLSSKLAQNGLSQVSTASTWRRDSLSEKSEELEAAFFTYVCTVLDTDIVNPLCPPSLSKSNIPVSSTSPISLDLSFHFLSSLFVSYVTDIRK